MRVKRKNKGDVLITLVVAFLIVGLLTSSAIHYAYTGLEITKTFNKYSGKSYMAEKALNVIKAGIEEDCSHILEKQYDRMLDTYAYTPNSQRNLTFKEYYVNALKEQFLGVENAEHEFEEVDVVELFKGYINAEAEDGSVKVRDNMKLATTEDGPGIHIVTASSPEFSDTEIYFVFKDIRVSYVDEQGFSSTVGADIKVEVPFIFDDTEEGFAYDSGYLDYALVANGKVIYDTSGTAKIHGGVYAGKGVEIGETSNAVLEAESRYFNTRGDINVYSGASLKVGAAETGNYANLCDIYAKNVILQKHSDNTSPVRVELDGNTYVEDDLEINAKNSYVKLGGTYTGYGMSSTYQPIFNITDEAKENSNSSIIINTPDSVLDMGELRTLKILGNASIIPPRSTGFEVITDESVTSKHMQIMYAVPSVCFSTLTNPVPSSVVDRDDFKYDYAKSASSGGLDLLDAKYDIDAQPIAVNIPGTGDNDGLVYYFLKFKSKAGQSAYIDDYSKVYTDYLTNKTRSIMHDGRVIVGDEVLIWSDGNVMQFEDSISGTDPTLKLINGVGVAEGEAMAQTIKGDADSLNATLMYNQGVVRDTEDYNKGVWNNVIKQDVFQGNKLSKEYGYYTLDDALFKAGEIVESAAADYRANQEMLERDGGIDCVIYLNKSGDESYTVPAEMTKGLLIADCDVVLNHSFIGLIIANGNITISGTNIEIYNEDADAGIYPAMYLLLKYVGQDCIREYFSNYQANGGGTEQSSSLKLKSLITFDNWVSY